MHQYNSLGMTELSPLVKRYVSITLGVIIVFVLLLLLPWRQTVQGVATLTALDPSQRDYKVAATIDGFIEKFHVKENQYVKKGEKLFTMVDLDTHYQSRLETISGQTSVRYENEKRKLAYLEENLDNIDDVTKSGLEVYMKKIEQYANMILFWEKELEASKNTLQIEESQYHRFQKLHQEGIESQRSMELKRNLYLQSKANLQKSRAKLQNARQNLQIAQKEKIRFESEMKLKRNEAQSKIIDTRNKVHALKQELERNENILSRYQSRDIVAKNDGYVLRIYQNDTNKLIKKGDEILYFSPVVTQRALRLKVSDFHMPLMKKGLKARIIFYGWPAMQISGWPKISHGTYGGIIRSIERSSYEKGVYYVMVTEDPDDAPWPSTDALKIGTQANIWVTLGIVPIWYELWRLIVAQPPQMVTPATTEELPLW